MEVTRVTITLEKRPGQKGGRTLTIGVSTVTGSEVCVHA